MFPKMNYNNKKYLTKEQRRDYRSKKRLSLMNWHKVSKKKKDPSPFSIFSVKYPTKKKNYHNFDFSTLG